MMEAASHFRYLAVRAYGDCLISLSLLHRLPNPPPGIEVLGTAVTERVAALTGLNRLPIRRTLADVAAFYDVKVRGAAQALEDLLHLRSELRRTMGPGDVLLVEHEDWRNHLLLPRRSGRYLEPRRQHSIYVDRARMLEVVFGVPLQLEPCRRAPPAPRSLLINPGARQAFRSLPAAVVNNLIDYAGRRGIPVRLLDPQASMEFLRPRVAGYLKSPPLEEAITWLREADWYIGADSFFLHLAYHYGIAPFGVTPWRSFYFAPPGLLEQEAHMLLDVASDPRALAAALDRALLT
jgi:hypothetical protein